MSWTLTPSELEALINHIRSKITVLRSVTMIALSAIKEDAPINVLADAPPFKARAPARLRR